MVKMLKTQQQGVTDTRGTDGGPTLHDRQLAGNARQRSTSISGSARFSFLPSICTPSPPAAGRAPPPTSRLVAVRLRPQTLLPLPATLLPARAMATNGSSPVRGPARLTLLFIPYEMVVAFWFIFCCGRWGFCRGFGTRRAAWRR